MRVLHVMEAMIGGTRRHLVDLARGEQRAGLDVHVAGATLRTPDVTRDLDLLATEGIGVTRIQMQRSVAPASDRRHVHELRALLRHLRPDIVHTHSSKAGALGRWASWREGLGARVHTPHVFSFLFVGMFGTGPRAGYRLIERWLAERTARVIAVGEDEAATIRASGVVPQARLRVVTNGLDPRPFQTAPAADRARLGFSPDVPLLLCAGQFNHAKGQDLLIDAIAQTGLEHVQLALAGEGELQTALEARVAALGLGRRVRFLGVRDDMPALLAAADLYVLPSRWEGMPYVVLEAMATGRPVVATPVDGARELLRDGRCGRLTAAIAPGALADALRELLDRPRAERDAMGRAGAVRVVRDYPVERMVARTIDVYRELA